jgi:hypothetical protein
MKNGFFSQNNVMKHNLLPILAFFIFFFCAAGFIYLAKHDLEKSSLHFTTEPNSTPTFLKHLQDLFN